MAKVKKVKKSKIKNVKNKRIKKVKEIIKNNNGLASGYIDKWVIVRTWASGVHFAKLREFDATNRHALLENSRRIWKWEGAFTLSEVSLHGIKNGKIAETLPEFMVTQVEEIIPCSERAITCLSNFAIYIP